MASLTQEQLKEITAIATATVAHLQGASAFGLGSHGGGGGNRAILDERNFRRIEKFDNKESEWDQWQESVEVAVSAVHWGTAKMMEEVAKMDEFTDDKFKERMDDLVLNAPGLDSDIFSQEQMKVKQELFQHLCLWTQGESNTIVRGVRSRNGYEAWRKLLTRLAPRTAARRLQSMMSIMRPNKAKDVRSFGKVLEVWELQVNEFMTHFREKISINMKVAIVIGMAPAEIQDMIFSTGPVKVEKMSWRNSGNGAR